MATGCSGSGGPSLGVGDVTSIPNGTATGTAASGTYAVTIAVSSCTGTCTVTGLGLTVSLCTAGGSSASNIIVVQSGGHLTAQTTAGDSGVASYSGGIDSDGSFDVGGATTNADGEDVTVTSEATGSLEGNVLSATVQTLYSGDASGNPVNCQATTQVSGVRTGG
jgi:hypothetical protein